MEEVVNHRHLEREAAYLALGTRGLLREDCDSASIAVQDIGSYLHAFPDFHLTIDSLVVDGNVLMARLTATGTHLGTLFCMPPTGKRIRVAVLDAWRVDQGRCIQRWLHLDLLSLATQLGSEWRLELTINR